MFLATNYHLMVVGLLKEGMACYREPFSFGRNVYLPALLRRFRLPIPSFIFTSSQRFVLATSIVKDVIVKFIAKQFFRFEPGRLLNRIGK